MTKADIAVKLKSIEKHGFVVYSFGDRRPLRKGSKDWVDNVIIGNRVIALTETKIGKDQLSKGQLILKGMIEYLAKKTSVIRYYLITEDNVDEVFKEILQA